MIQSYYTLRALADEFHTALAGSVVSDCLSQTKSELAIVFDTGTSTSTIRTSVARQSMYTFLDHRFSTAKKNVARLFPVASNRSVEAITVAERDRCIFIKLAGGYELAIALTGASGNVHLIDSGATVIESFSSGRRLPLQRSEIVRPASTFPEKDDWIRLVSENVTGGASVVKAISSSYAFFDSQVSREIVRRSGIEFDRKVVFPAMFDDLYQQAYSIEEEMHSGNGSYIAEYSSGLKEFSIYKPMQGAEHFDLVNTGVRTYLIESWRSDYMARTVGAGQASLQKRYDELNKALGAIQTGLSKPSREADFRLWADMLMAHGGKIVGTGGFFSMPSFVDPSTMISIPTKEGLSRTELAEHYYDKARRAKKRRKIDSERLKSMSADREHTGQLLEQALQIKDPAEWRVFEAEHKLGAQKRAKNSDERDGSMSYREYVLPDDYRVYVGRNARQNDSLTTKFARKDDFWLHARGVPGSHVVLKVKGREEPPRFIQEMAASIAAYHSKARTSSLAPVIIVRKKFVRKPRGAQKGTVVVDRENVLLVEPGLPDNQKRN